MTERAVRPSVTTHAVDLVGRPVGGDRRLQPGGRRRRLLLGGRHDGRRAGRRVRAIPATRRPRPGRRLAIIGAALEEAGFALADVVRTRMFVTDIARSARDRRRPRRDLRRDPAGGDDGRGPRADRSEPADRDRGRRPTRLTVDREVQGRSAIPSARRDRHDRDRGDQAQEQVAPPRDDREAHEDRHHSMPTWNDGTPVRRPSTTITRPRRARPGRPARRAAGSRAPAAAGGRARASAVRSARDG